ncbi:MAG: hypothetical protein ACTHMG_09750 [Sphingomonas sp.]
MSDRDLVDLAPTLPDAERRALVLDYWRRGEMTPLALANALARASRPAAAPAAREAA